MLSLRRFLADWANVFRKFRSSKKEKKSNLESIDSRQLDSLRVFHEVASALTSSLNLDDLLRTIMAKMESYFKPEQWSLLILDEETQELYYALTIDGLEEGLRDVRLAIGEGLLGRVAASGQPLLMTDLNEKQEWRDYAALHPHLQLHSLACLPIHHGGKLLGVLQLHNSEIDVLPESSLTLLRAVCSYTAIALQNASHVKLIHRLTITDDCTGLFNQRYLYEMLEDEVRQYNAQISNRVVSIHAPHFSLLFLDLDHFKSINDTHGHQDGSRLLAEIGGLIKRTIGPKHYAFRYGGDEFVVLLRNLDKPAALKLTEQLREALITTRYLTATDHPLFITGSFGLATFPQDGNTIKTIIANSDTMMYNAKHNGRNRIEVADPANPATLPAPKSSRHS
jgi:diguanylate cyclase (GGDEF)-like protein